MEEIYILSDGSKVDLSGKSQFEITSFLIKNPGAKKTKVNFSNLSVSGGLINASNALKAASAIK